jgi:DNA-binding transcriptional LysR family regulator
VPRGELVIAANEATCIYVLPGVFSRYKGLFPNVQLHVDRSYGSKVVQAVNENMADFGITQLPVDEKRLEVVKIHADEIRAIVRPDHPLAARRVVVAADLEGWPLLMPKTGTTRSRLNSWTEGVEERLNISMELDSTEMIKRFVMAGLGVSFLAASHCREEVDSGRIVAIPLGPEPMIRRLGLIYRKDKALSKAALGLIEVVLEQSGSGLWREPLKEMNGIQALTQ